MYRMMEVDIEKFRVKNAPSSVFYIPDFITKEEEEMLMSKVYNAPRTKWTVLSHRRLQNWGGLPGPKGMVGEDLPGWLSTYAKKISDLGAFEGKVPNHVLVNEYEPEQGIMPHEDGPAFYPTVSTISLGSHTLLDFYYHLNTAESKDNQPEGAASTRPDASTPSADSQNSSAGDVKRGAQSTDNSSEQGSQSKSDSSKDISNTVGCGDTSPDAAVISSADTCDTTSFESRHFLSLLLQPRSLVLLQDDMYKVHLHGIKEVKQDVITDKVVNLDLCPGVAVGDTMDRDTRVSLTIRYVPKVLKSKLIFGKR